MKLGKSSDCVACKELLKRMAMVCLDSVHLTELFRYLSEPWQSTLTRLGNSASSDGQFLDQIHKFLAMAIPMDEEEDAELQRAFEMSLAPEDQREDKKQEDTSPIEPDAKRSKASMETAQPLESMEVEKSEAMRQRELRAAAAEKRMRSMQKEVSQPAKTPVLSPATANSPSAAGSPSNTAKAALVAKSAAPAPKSEPVARSAGNPREAPASSLKDISNAPSEGLGKDLEAGKLTPQEAERLYRIVFGSGASPEVLSQWSRQGFRLVKYLLSDGAVL
jgi:hypothetical protein